jgi:hypothetical protein
MRTAGNVCTRFGSFFLLLGWVFKRYIERKGVLRRLFLCVSSWRGKHRVTCDVSRAFGLPIFDRGRANAVILVGTAITLMEQTVNFT